MNPSDAHVLILDAYARQTLPAVRGFKDINCTVTVVCFSKLDVGYASNKPDYKIILNCSKEDYEKQYQLVKELIESKKYDLVVPMTDYSARYLSNNKEYLSKFSHIAVNNKDIFEKAINKLKTMKLCEENNIPSPKTLFTEDVGEIINNSELNYPLVIKPISGCGSIGFNIIYNKEHLKRALSTKNSDHPVFVQEYIPQDGPQYVVEIYRNLNGSYAFSLVTKKQRWYPIDGGASTINISVHDSQIVEYSKKLLDACNWIGYANIDFVIDKRDNEPKLLEINGRLSAITSINECVGYNVPRLIFNTEVNKENAMYGEYEDGIKVSCILTELLWFIKSKDRLSNKPTFFSRKNTKDVIFRLDDQKPFFSFCIQSVMNYKHAMKLRSRQ